MDSYLLLIQRNFICSDPSFHSINLDFAGFKDTRQIFIRVIIIQENWVVVGIWKYLKDIKSQKCATLSKNNGLLCLVEQNMNYKIKRMTINGTYQFSAFFHFCCSWDCRFWCIHSKFPAQYAPYSFFQQHNNIRFPFSFSGVV